MTPEEQVLANIDWKNALTGNIFTAAIFTLFFILLLVVFFVLGFIAEVSQDWPRYRCKPVVMPFADFFGYDTNENFTFCLQKIFESQSGQALSPIYQLLAQYSSSVGLMVNSVNGFRKLLGNFMTSTNMFIRNVRNKVQALLFQVRLSFMKMQVLMNRVYGTMYSIVWMGNSAITAGLNLSDNDLVQFLFEFCFHPETAVKLVDGTVVPIYRIEVGDVLEGGVKVTSRFTFKGEKTPMVQIGSDILSSQHMVQMPHTGVWRPAFDHPEAVTTASIPELICLNVEGHRFKTAAGLVVADYDESESTAAIQRVQAMAEKALNGGMHQGPTVAAYDLGFDADALLHMDNAAGEPVWKPVQTVKLGDRLYGGSIVMGVVEEACENVRLVDGVFRVAAAQLVFHDGLWKRAAAITEEHQDPTCRELGKRRLRQFITDRTGVFHLKKRGKEMWVRDYREAPLPEMETPYMEALLAE